MRQPGGHRAERRTVTSTATGPCRTAHAGRCVHLTMRPDMRQRRHGELVPPGPSHHVATACRQALGPVGVDGAGVALVTQRGHRATVHASDTVAERIEEAQFALGEGPCVDAAASGSPVLVDDLDEVSPAVRQRWPAFLDAIAQVGARAVFAFPLRIGAINFGAVDMYRRTPGPLSKGQLKAALLTADTLALLMLDLTTADQLDRKDGGPPSGRLHAEVHQASGMVKVQLGTTIENGLAQLRAVAFAQERPIDEVASDVVTGRLRFPLEDA